MLAKGARGWQEGAEGDRGMFEPNEDGVLMELAAAPARRGAAVGALYLAGGLLVWLGATAATAGAIAVIGLGAGGLVLAEILRRSSRVGISLTVEGLFDSRGVRIAGWDEIAGIERGSFALKPSNGFGLRLREPAPRAWVPGVWWRIGRRVGIGGVLPPRPTRFMAEQMALKLAERDGS